MCERDQELLDVSELLVRFATARLKGLSSPPAPPTPPGTLSRCLAFFSEGVRGFLHSLPALFAFSETLHFETTLSVQSGLIHAVVNIKY